MKRMKFLIVCLLLSLVVVNSGFTPCKEKKGIITYEIWSVDRDIVNVAWSGYNVGAYSGFLRTNLSTYYLMPIYANESIAQWCEGVNPPWSGTGDFVDQSDADEVGLVKFMLEDGVRIQVMELIGGDSLE
jgi:hypothetical protein